VTGEETRNALASFYDALARRDARTLAGMYAPDAAFEDPVFRLRGAEIGRMWEVLLGRAREFSVAYTIARSGHDEGTVEWTARYLFGGGRPVVNVILSELRFRDGLIVTQKDVFDFPRWAAQALGPAGRWLGRFEWFRRSVARKARRELGISPRSS